MGDQGDGNRSVGGHDGEMKQSGIVSAKMDREMRCAGWIHFYFKIYLPLILAWPKKRSSEAKCPIGPLASWCKYLTAQRLNGNECGGTAKIERTSQ